MLKVKPFSPRDRKYNAWSQLRWGRDWEVESRARDIVRHIAAQGSEALCAAVGAAAPGVLRVTEQTIIDSRQAVSEQFLTSVSLARVNLRKFHEDQRRHSSIHDESDGVRVTRQVRALGRVGICCGRSFSSLLLQAVPAQMAGVRSLVVAAAPEEDGNIDPKILAVAKLLDITEIYSISGAPAVAAMAYGVDPISRPVDKIVGGDGAMSQAAKRAVAGIVGVDAERGLGDLLIIADGSANARFIASDLLAQAEHAGDDSFLGLFTEDRLLAEAVRIEVGRLADHFPRSTALREVIGSRGLNLLFPDVITAVHAANTLAPARLSLQTAVNGECLSEVETAGAVFLGAWSVEASGDCFAGINPYLPVRGQAPFSSGLGIDDFVRELSIAEYSPDRLLRTGRHLAILAEEEGLSAHASAIRDRLELLKLTVD